MTLSANGEGRDTKLQEGSGQTPKTLEEKLQISGVLKIKVEICNEELIKGNF